MIVDCNLWYQEESWWSHQLQHLQELNSFMGLVFYLKANLLAFTFEFSELWDQADAEHEVNPEVNLTTLSDEEVEELFPATMCWLTEITLHKVNQECKERVKSHRAEGHAQHLWAHNYEGRRMPAALRGFQGSQTASSVSVDANND